MPDFELNHSVNGVLGGGSFSTGTLRMAGMFRDIQFTFTQNGVDQGCEPHFFEFHYMSTGVVEATGIFT